MKISRMSKLLSNLFAFTILFIFSMCNSPSGNPGEAAKPAGKMLTSYVNPFIGTQNMGHTFPGAAAPFGMVQLSPDTRQLPMFIDGLYNPDVYKYCAGYQYDDSLIYGFSHTHFSGTGHSDLGDFLMIPASGVKSLMPQEYALAFSHQQEKASPGYYQVYFQQKGINVELTASERVGVHRYRFENQEQHSLMIDFRSNIYPHDDKNVWTFVRVENDSTITGYRQTTGWARTRIVYFALRFSKAFTSYGHHKFDSGLYKGFYRKFDEEHNFPEMAGRELMAWFDFGTEPGEEVQAFMALSSVSTDGALKNLKKEAGSFDFETILARTEHKWEQELSRIRIETLQEEDKISFYTSLYHTMLSPVIYEDIDGRYRGLDQNNHNSAGFRNYTIFSLWDTYRTLHPLFNLIQSERNNDMIQSMLAHQEESVHGMLPVWSHYSNENWCMIGYHAVSVITDAFVNQTTSADIHKALKACVATANVDYFDGIGSYKELGFVAEDLSSNSVSKTLEYAYNDWCIARLAKLAGDTVIEAEFLKRSGYFEHLFDSISGFMRPKLANGAWKEPFDPMDTHGQGFIEGNAYNYGLYIPHHPERLVELLGGKSHFSAFLDTIFNMELDDKYMEKNEDITREGLIGTYVHGNEPGHHIPYLYNYSDAPWKTQERVRMILRKMYLPEIDGLCGNDDAGQMSAWYIMSSLGFYPLCPGSGMYEIGSPLVVSAMVRLPRNLILYIETENQSEENVYVQTVRWNGKVIQGNQLPVAELLQGGKLIFTMGPNPSKEL